MRMDRQQHSWIIDAVLFGGFLLALWLDLTGVNLHQWLGVAIAALAVWHLLAHGKWVKTVTARFFGRTSRQARLYYITDAAMLAGLIVIVVTGLVISTWTGLTLAIYAAWHGVHVWASVLTLAVLVAKIGLHWRWIVGVVQRYVILPAVSASRVTPPASELIGLAPATVPVRVGRRDFIRLMSVVGAASVLTAANVLSGQQAAAAEPATAATATTTRTRPNRFPGRSSSATASAGSCTVQCGRGCSYPGRCRRYVDTNGNNRCDLGECLS